MPPEPAKAELTVKVSPTLKESLQFMAARRRQSVDEFVDDALSIYLYGKKGVYLEEITRLMAEEKKRLKAASKVKPRR